MGGVDSVDWPTWALPGSYPHGRLGRMKGGNRGSDHVEGRLALENVLEILGFSGMFKWQILEWQPQLVSLPCQRFCKESGTL